MELPLSTLFKNAQISNFHLPQIN